MKRNILAACCLTLCFVVLAGRLTGIDQNRGFHGAPASSMGMIPPSDSGSALEGKPLYERYCANCHGMNGTGTGNIPSLTSPAVRSTSIGELFWFISKGEANNGMPSWHQLAETQRWQIVSYLKAPGAFQRSTVAAADAAPFSEVLPAPRPPFTDYRFEKPGQAHKITLQDLPGPFDSPSASNGPKIVPRPPGTWPKAPKGFQVTLYARGLDNPRRIRRAPNGDLFVAEVSTGKIEIFRGIDSGGHPRRTAVFATLDRPFGMNFYPPGPDPRWVYVATTTAVVRVPYRSGDLQARGPFEHIMDLPDGGHNNRDVLFEPGGRKMLVTIPSFSNADDSDGPMEKNRAKIFECNPDGSEAEVYADGIRNPSFMALNPKTNDLWITVNERDGFGDNLVPDYITHVRRGGFYGWPWWYMGGHQDPRFAGKHPELKDKIITPDVLLQPHNASVGLAFYDARQFPAEYSDNIFAAEHGSWNKSVRAGYEVIRIRLGPRGEAMGGYEDFLTGFVVNNKSVWGRPAGVAVGADGSLFVTDDGSNSIWRVKYVGN